MSLRAADSLSNGFENPLEAHRSSQPNGNLEEAPPIPGIRYVLNGSLVVLSALHMILNSSLKVNDTNILTTAILNLHITK